MAATRARLLRRKQRLAVAAAGLCLAAAASWVLVWRSSVPSASPVRELEASTVSMPPAGLEQVTRFADGSSATVLADGQLVVQTASETLVETVLNAGTAEFDVVPNPVRQFVVQAGLVTVEVIGTHFHVERGEARTRVSVDRGKVRVSWDGGKAVVEAGESRWFPEQRVEAAEVQRLPASPSPSSGSRERFVELASSGDYQGAYKLMSQSPSSVGSSAEELMLAADSARLSNHPAEALTYLKRVTREYPGDARAALSAFTQGRILLSQLGKPADAAKAFELARRLSPGGALAEDALARQAEALFQAGANAQGRALAAEYEKRYPTGKHLATLGKLRAPADSSSASAP